MAVQVGHGLSQASRSDPTSKRRTAGIVTPTPIQWAPRPEYWDLRKKERQQLYLIATFFFPRKIAPL
jgi:hypothetical protein